MKQRNLVIVTQYYPPEIGGGSQRSFGFAAEMASLGWNVTVVAPYPSYLMHASWKLKFRLFEHSNEGSISVFRTFVLAGDRSTFVKRLVYYVSFACAATMLILSKLNDVDVIMVISPPLFTGIGGIIAKRRFGCKFIFDVGDLWPESAVQLGILKNKFLIRLSEKLEAWIYAHADVVNLVTPRTREVVRRNYPMIKQTMYVPNFVDTSTIRKRNPDNFLRQSLGLQGKFVVGYFGNIGIPQGLSILVDAADRTRDFRNVSYLIVGEGIERQMIADQIGGRSLRNIQVLSPVAKDEISRYLSVVHAMVVPLVKNDLFKMTIPSKLYEALAAEIPVILCVDGEARTIVENNLCGVYVEPENSQMLAEKILMLHKAPQLVAELGRNGRHLAESTFCRKAVVADFELAMLDLWAEAKPIKKLAAA